MIVFTQFPKKLSQKGFTLIEIVIAITVFAIGLLAINIMQTSAIKGNSTSNGISFSTNIASDRIEQIIADSYVNLANGSDNSTAAYPTTWTMTEDIPIVGTKTVTISVTRDDRGINKTTSLQFTKADKI